MKKLPILAFLLLLFTPAMSALAKPAEAAGQLPPSTTPIACYVNTGWGREEYLYIQYNVVNSIDGLRWALKVDGVDDDQIDQEYLIDFPAGEYTGYAKFKLGLNESNGYETYRYSMFIKDKQTSGLVPHKVYASGDLRAMLNCVDVTDLLLTTFYVDEGENTWTNLQMDNEYFKTHSIEHNIFEPGYDCSSGVCVEMPINQHEPEYIPSGLTEEVLPISQHYPEYIPGNPGFEMDIPENAQPELELEIVEYIEDEPVEIIGEPIVIEDATDLATGIEVQELEEMSGWELFLIDLRIMLEELLG